MLCFFYNITSLTGAVCSVMFPFGMCKSSDSINKSLVRFSAF